MNRNAIVAALIAALAVSGCDALMGSRHTARDRERDRAAADCVVIAKRTIDFSRDRETIEVGSQRRFHAVQLAVKDGPVELSNVVVTFGDGSTFSPQLRSVFEEGTESRTIDLPGDARRIQRIDLASRSTSKRAGKATIIISGC